MSKITFDYESYGKFHC